MGNANQRQKLTKAAIDALSPPSSGRIFVYDSAITGLCICVTSSGTRTWYLYRKVNRRPVRLKLGRWPEVSAAQARQLATEAAGLAASGRDVHKERQQRRERGIVWRDLFSLYLSQHAKTYKKTWREDQAIDRRYLQDWANRAVSSISRQDVAGLHQSVGKDAPFAANRLLSLLSKVFNWAQDEELATSNPAARIKKFRERSRNRFVLPDEMPRLLKAIKAHPDKKLADFFLLCLLLGARKSNILAMEWRHIDFSSGVWTIPDTKSGEPAAVVISTEAKSILLRRKSEIDQNDARSQRWVFPSHSKVGHLTEPKKAWKSIKNAANLPDLRIHDLRRTLGSWQAAAGSSLPVIAASLGQTTQQATEVYARLQIDSVRHSVETAVQAMLRSAHKTKDTTK